MRSARLVNYVLVAYAAQIDPHDAIAFVNVVRASYVELVRAVKALQMLCLGNVQPSEILAPTAESRETDASRQSHLSLHSIKTDPLDARIRER